jgi:regulator of protease activity HflC (stomatin/prohibitin superfamily)
VPELILNLVVLLIVLGIVGILLSQTVRVVREYRRLVVFRLGNCIGARGPGLALLIPFVDRPVDVDLRELFVEIPHQSRSISPSTGRSWTR